MSIPRDKLVQRAQVGRRESKSLDFKTGFDVNSREEWCEIIKDIVAFANSGGGAIVLGANNDGSPANVDVSPYLNLDPADITNKIRAYTGYEFAEFEIMDIDREGRGLALWLVFAVDTPMVFLRNGSDQWTAGKQRPAFVKGSVYFRHGAKSEPGTSDDLRQWRERSLDAIRKTWMGGIRKVVESNPNKQIQVVTVASDMAGGIKGRISSAPDAIPMNPQNAEDIWPYRQTDLVKHVLAGLPKGTHFNGYDVQCIRRIHRIDPQTRPDFVFKPHEMSSPQYSKGFVTWILKKGLGNDQFFKELRRQVLVSRRKSH